MLLLAGGLLLACWSAFGFFELAGDMREGDTDRFDEAVLMWLASHRSPTLTNVYLAITALGSWPVITLFTVGTCVAMLLANERRFAVTLFVTMAGVPVIATSFKRFYGRARPSVVPYLETVADPSYPSAHTVASVTFFVTVALLVASHTRRRPLKLFLIGYSLVIAALVAVSRVYLGVHYPSDVAGGALIGIAWSLAIVIIDLFFRRGKSFGLSKPPEPQGLE